MTSADSRRSHLLDVPRLPLSDGWTIPAVGLGTAPKADEEAAEAVMHALQRGYRLIDTGAIYGNEHGVGRGLAASGVDRSEVSVMTKVRGRDHGYDAARTAFHASRERLGLAYVDLYLIHWPLPMVDLYVDTWRALIRLRDEGWVRSIGVSNFRAEDIDRLRDETGVAPAVNQIEMHPGFRQDELRAFHHDLGIRTIAYSPLGRGSGLLSGSVVREIAEKYAVAPAQVVLRWHLQRETVPIPRASNGVQARQNLDLFDFALTADEVERVGQAYEQRRVGFDPATREEL